MYVRQPSESVSSYVPSTRNAYGKFNIIYLIQKDKHNKKNKK